MGCFTLNFQFCGFFHQRKVANKYWLDIFLYFQLKTKNNKKIKHTQMRCKLDKRLKKVSAIADTFFFFFF